MNDFDRQRKVATGLLAIEEVIADVLSDAEGHLKNSEIMYRARLYDLAGTRTPRDNGSGVVSYCLNRMAAAGEVMNDPALPGYQPQRWRLTQRQDLEG